MSAKEYALSLVGQGYIYGAKGQICSRAFREIQAEQYPEYASNILETGAKWDGVPVWDCAQLTRAVARLRDVDLPSGATSQWNKAEWKRKGGIETLPKDEMCFVYRRQGGKGNVMSHTGVALGDGTCVHARGTAYGVVLQLVQDFGWTDWASPWETYKEEEPMAVLHKAVVTAASGGTVRVRNRPEANGLILTELKIGTIVDVLNNNGEWSNIRFNGGLNGYMMSRFLKKEGDYEKIVSIEIPEQAAVTLMEALQSALK